MSHDQDWKTISIGNPKKAEAKQALLTGKNIIRKDELPKSTINPSVKLDENDEVVKIKYVPKEVSIAITNGRNAKKLTRKQLAQELNLKEDIVTDIENGKAIYNGNIIAKIKKHLEIK